MPELKILYCGARQVGADCLDVLNDTPGIKVVFLIADKMVDDLERINSNAEGRNSIPGFTNENRHEERVLGAIKAFDPHVLISAKHPWIFSKRIIKAMNGNAYNLHCGKLPDYKGWNACSNAILNGDVNFTVTIHKIEPKVDTGGIILEKTFDIDARDTAGTIDRRATEAGVKIMRQFANMLASGDPFEVEPVPSGGKYYSRKADKQIILDYENASEIALMARAWQHSDHDPAYFYHNGMKYEVSVA